MNPATLRCVRLTGRRGQEIVQRGVDLLPQQLMVMGNPYFLRPRRDRAVTRRNSRHQQETPRNQQKAPKQLWPCPPGSTRNPRTRRCVKMGGRIYKKLVAPLQQPVPTLQQQLQRPIGNRRRQSSAPLNLPQGIAGVIPLTDPHTWLAANCTNHRAFAKADAATLQNIIRLHNRQCVVATRLNDYITAKQSTGAVPTLPGTQTPLTPADFDALKAAMRRRNPAYQLPSLPHASPPPEWQLYVAQDRNSGHAFATVAYVDTTKAIPTATGYHYQEDSIRIPLGFLPVKAPAGATCSPQRVIDLLSAAATANRLLVPTAAGGWRPSVGGLPAAKSDWSGAGAAHRFNRLCAELGLLVA